MVGFCYCSFKSLFIWVFLLYELTNFVDGFWNFLLDLLHTFSYLPRDLNFIDHTSNIGWKE